MFSMGISTKFVNAIKSLNEGSEAPLWGFEEMFEFFSFQSGVEQGCLLSLYIFVIDGLCEYLDRGVLLGTRKVKILLYADDLLADTPDSLQKIINATEKYCQLWNLKLNPQKSKIVIYKKSGRNSKLENWNFRTDSIEVVPNCKYLGITLLTHLSCNI